MDGGGSVQSNEERGAEKLMDEYLKSIGLHRKKIAKDGSCLFRAVAEQVLHCQSLHTKVRAKCVDFLKQNRESYEAFIEGDFEEYLLKLQDPQQWVGEVEINALAVIYKRDFLIFQEPGKPAVNITDNNFEEKVQLCFLNGNHYDSVYPISHLKSAALCQSVLYELLYDGVFKVDRSFLGACQRISRPSDVLIDDNLNACNSSDESDADGGETPWAENGTSTTAPRNQSYRGRGRARMLPDRVRRSLNPTLFRNIEYDVWHKSKRAQQKLDYCIAAGMQFTVGDRCQVRLEGSGRSYSATIREVPANNGPVTVYLEELGTRKQVPLWNLRPPNDDSSWSTVVNRDKRLSNGHGEWEERGRGRGRGRSLPAASSSAPQAPAPGTGGRVQKQHSWPQQAAGDEPGGARAARKSVSSVEAAFGLTEEQRLAKEEEERNVALVEIQLRDELSFPALGAQGGVQGDGGKRKGGDKRKSLRSKTKSPVEDVRAPSPSVGDRPKSSSPPPAPTAPPAAPAAPAAPASTSDPGPTCAKTNALSYASATAPSSPPPPPAPSVPSSASVFPFLTPALPAAAPSPPLPPLPSSSSPLPPQSSASPPPSSSLPTPTFIAPIAPSPGFLPPSSLPRSSPPVSSLARSPSPPSSFATSSLMHPAARVQEAAPVSAPSSSPNTGVTLLQNQNQISVSQTQSSLTQGETQSQPSQPQNIQIPQTRLPPLQNTEAASLPQTQIQPPVLQAAFPLSQVSVPNLQSQSQVSAPNLQSQSQVSVPNLQSQSQVSAPNLQSQSQVSVPNLQSQSQVSVPNLQSQSQVSAPNLQSQSQVSVPNLQSQSQVSVPNLQSQSQVSVPNLQSQSQVSVPNLQSQSQVSAPHLQSQSQVSVSNLQSQSQSQFLLQSQSELPQIQTSHPAPGASYPQASQASVPVSAPVQLLAPHPHLQPPHPSQVPHPSLSLSSSHPSLQSQTQDTQTPTEAPLPPAQHPESPARAPSQPSHPPPPSHHAQLQSAPPPQHQSVLGAVPLQQLSQLYLDPLYPGFPQAENGSIAPNPPISSSRSGDDLPQDLNILRFFFNLGVKAYTMPMFPPYIYLLPLQQAHTMHPKLPSRSPSPTPQYPPPRHQELYPHPPYPPTSASMPPHYDHQTPLAEPAHPVDPSFNQAGYPVPQPPPPRMSCPSTWQQHQMPPPRNPSYPVGYLNQSYRAPPPVSQGYHPSQGPGHPPYPQYPPSSLGYQPSSNLEELQLSQGIMEQRHPPNGDPMPAHGPGRGPGLLESPAAAANMANANNNRPVPGFAHSKEHGDGLSRVMLLVDPPFDNKPILVPNPDVKDVSMTTIKPGGSPGPPLPYDIISKTDNNPSRGYRGHRKPLNPTNTYEPGQVGYLSSAVAESLSVGCSTEDDWEQAVGFKHTTMNHRGSRKSHRGGGGGRGRGGHDPGRGGQRRRQGGEVGMGAGFNYVQYNSSYRGRGRERGY